MYLIITENIRVVEGAVRRSHELIDVIEVAQYKRQRKKYPRALFILSENPEKDKQLFRQAELKKVRKVRSKELEQPRWNFKKLPSSELELVKNATKEKDIKELDKIRVKYQLASKCMTCRPEVHAAWLMASFKTYLITQNGHNNN